MGRWRPPEKPSSPYVTAQGAKDMREELQQLWRVERPEVVKALSAAAAEGDRSENAEYIYRKKQLGGIDRRVRYLSKRLDHVQVIDQIPQDKSKVRFGAWVTLQGEGGDRLVYRIVGADETNARLGWISIDSPVARGLLGRGIDEDVVVETPENKREMVILAIDYDAPGDSQD